MKKFIVLGLDGAVPDIIDEYVRKGELKNFGRLRETGSWGINLPFPSAVTPGNWAAIASGTCPGTNGISDFSVHIPGEDFDVSHNAFRAEMCRAELMWDALSRQGRRTATINYPCSAPRRSENHTRIGDDGMPAESLSENLIAPARLFVSGGYHPVGDRNWVEYERVKTNSPDRWDNLPEGWRVLCEFQIEVKAVSEGCAGSYGKHVGVMETPGGLRVVIGPERDWSSAEARLPRQRWSDWLRAYFTRRSETVEAAYRFRVVEVEKDGGCQLYLSVVYPTTAFCEPKKYGEILYKKFGQYTDVLNISKLRMGWLDPEAVCNEFRQQGVWQAKAALELLNSLGHTGVFLKWHAFDKFYHFFFDKIDPMSPGFEPGQFTAYEEIHREILGIADEMVGIVLDGMDGETTLVAISDHGLMASRRAAWVNNFLAVNGYITLRPDGAGGEEIDWEHTRAIMRPYVQLWINLQGRDPHGCVHPGDYGGLCGELVEKLRSWRDPDTGEYVMAEVFRIDDGAHYGLWGERDGDIRVHTTPGYTLYRSQSITPDRVLVTDVDGDYRGDHGSCRPTARFGRGSEYALFAAAGSGIRQGHRMHRPIRPCDVTPTLAHILGVLPPKDCEGAVIYEALR